MLATLDPDDPFQAFPGVWRALEEPNGLLALGGCLAPDRLLNAYRHGIFPWYNDNEPILWWSPDPRWVIYPERYKPSRSLSKLMRRRLFTFSYDRAFADVVDACAAPREDSERTWINSKMKCAYCELHSLGYAHSFEAWQDGRLVGGLYGVSIGRVFFGESMFHRVGNASKAVFAYAMASLAEWGYRLVDCQVHSPHMESLGAEAISRADFSRQLYVICNHRPLAVAWTQADVT